MSRLQAFLPHARIITLLLGVVGPFILMGMRAERVDLQVAMAICAAIAVGCSFAQAPLSLRIVGILTAVGAVVFQAIDVFGPDTTWGRDTAPVLWILQAILTGSLGYLVWWNQHRLLNG